MWGIVVPALLAGGAGGYRLTGQKPEAQGKSAPASIVEIPPWKKPEAPPKEGNPWKFYAAGDWKNAAYNFALARNTARPDARISLLEMGRGVAAFKAATADENHFDAVMIETAIEAFGAALATGDAGVLENAHYNLANAIFERAKYTEKQRSLAESKAKSKRAKQRNALTLKYVDGIIRQLENCLEHYQETLVLNAGRGDAQTNHDTVLELIRRLRSIRIDQAQREGLRKKKKMKCEGECEGECEGGGLGKSKAAAGDDGEDDGAGPLEDEKEQDGGEESNREFKGTPRAAGNPGEPDRGDENREPEKVDPGAVSEARRNEIIQRLKRLSQELPIRERNKIVPENRPPRDW
jgi:hypothetical protein